MALGQNQWHHVGVGAPPILVYFSGDWDVYRGYDLDFDPWPCGFLEMQIGLNADSFHWRDVLVGDMRAPVAVDIKMCSRFGAYLAPPWYDSIPLGELFFDLTRPNSTQMVVYVENSPLTTLFQLGEIL